MPDLKVCAVILLVVCTCLVRSARLSRIKRRVDEFGEMVLVKTIRNPLDFNGYGNWCGIGGEGEAVDEIDKCCMVHDQCYAHVYTGCATWRKYEVYTTNYRWSVKQGDITCDDVGDHCAKTLCECDKAAAECFGSNIEVYDQANKHSGILKALSRLLGGNGR